MATGGDVKRQSPVGMEFEPEEKDIENIVKFHLEAFRSVVIRDVTPIDLLIHYRHFTREQRKELDRLNKNESVETTVSKGLEMIASLDNQPNKYSALIEALEDTEYHKIVKILTGKIIPVNDKHRKHINSNFTFICLNVNPNGILHLLLSDKVINDTDEQRIRRFCSSEGPIYAMTELIYILPTKHENWYHYFMKALLEENSDVAEKIDVDVCQELRERRSQNLSMSCIEDNFSSCIPVNGQQASGRTAAQTKAQPSYSDTKEHVIQDFHEASMPANNLSAPDKSLLGDSLTESPDFQDILTDNENTIHMSVNQSASMRSGNYKSQGQGTRSLAELSSFDENQESLNFNSLLMDNSIYQSKSLNSQARTDGTERLATPKLSSITRNIGDGITSNSLKSNQDSVRTNSSNGITSLKTLSIESNDRVSVRGASTKGPEEAMSSGAIQGQMEAFEIYSRKSRDNSNSPPSKVMSDKNIEIVSGKKPLNITENEPEAIREEEHVEDVEITLRGYQRELAEPALQGKNVIIVAPTGSGKTRVALRIIQEHIRKQKGRGIPKVIFLVNQVALANQQGEECLKALKAYKTKVISGETQRGKKEYLKDFVDKRDILVVTAQVLLDALVRKEIEGINMFSLMVFDECHHTHANSTFNQIMGLYMTLKFSKHPPILPQIVGLTASVGVGKARNQDKAVEHIKKLMANLDAEVICTVQNNMQELRTYVALPDEETFTVSKRENDSFGETVKKLMGIIEQLMSMSSVVKEMEEAKQFEKVLKAPAEKGSAQYTQWVSRLWKETAKLRSQEARRFLNPCRTHLAHYNDALIIHNDARVEDALSYLDREMKSWSDQARCMDKNEKKLDSAFKKLRAHRYNNCSDNPKLQKLCDIIVKAYRRDPENSRGIVFVRTRELARAIINWMKETAGLMVLNPIQFLGQNSRATEGGMTKAEQDDVLKYFKDGKHKLIVATSVAEEGLDISKCNLVIRYDYVTNEIAMVQSRGRGRAKDSKYFVIAEDGKGMAEKEEMNVIREIMMRKAIIQLQQEIEEQPRKFKKDLHALQDEANLDHQLKSLGTKRRLPKVGNFELQCQRCGHYVCMSEDLKKIKDAHHVIVDESLQDRVDFVKNDTEECAVESNQPIGKLSCKGCGENLGVISIFRRIEFAVPRIEKFLIVDYNGRQITKSKWKDVPVVVSELSTDDFRKIIKIRQSNGTLEEEY